MARFRIPEKQLAALEELIALPEEEVSQLASALEQAQPNLIPSKFVSNVTEKLNGLDAQKAASIITALSGISSFKDSERLKIEEISSGILESAAESKGSASRLTPSTKSELEVRLAKLLSFEKTLGVSAKALNVMREHDKTFCDVRIMSDIRTVFINDSSCAEAGFVVHSLCLGYHQNKEHKEVFIALDTSDLKTLKDAIFRAEQKEIVLKNVLSKTEIRYLDVE